MKQVPFVIGDVEVAAGARVTVDLPAADLYIHTGMNLTAQVVHGRRPGPRLFVSAALHGDEINGVEIVRRLLKRKVLSSLKGTLVAIPVVNSLGFIHQSRYLPDRRDLNRVFPGSSNGSLAARLAHLFMEEIAARCTHGIDLHSGSNHRFNMPHIRADVDDEQTRMLANAFGAPLVVNSRTLDGSLREAVSERGIPVLLYEAGEALRFDELSIRTGVRGILAVMRAIGMLPPKERKGGSPVFYSPTSKWVRAPISGIVRSRMRTGSVVDKGDLLCIVSDPYDEVEQEVRAPISGVVLGRLELPLVYRGDAMFHIAVLEGDVEGAELIEALATELSQDDYRQPPR